MYLGIQIRPMSIRIRWHSGKKEKDYVYVKGEEELTILEDPIISEWLLPDA